jgi:Family of unknown function (DUF5681)
MKARRPGKKIRRIRIREKRDQEEVGYGKPPRATQFKPGQSGNPKGRPKGAKSENTILQELLSHKVGITERGKTRKIVLMEAILRKIAEDCLKGNIKSAAFLLNRYHAVVSGQIAQTEISQDDRKVLDDFISEMKLTGDDRDALS